MASLEMRRGRAVKPPTVKRMLAGLLLVLCCASAASAEFLVIPDNRLIASGGLVQVTLFVPNDSSEELAVELPARLTLRTRGVAAAPDIVLRPAESQQRKVRIKPGAFLRARYSGKLPEGLVGNLVLEPVDYEGSPLGISASESRAANLAATDRPATDDDGRTDAAASATIASDTNTARLATAFSPYEPNYVVIGSSGETTVKFQISTKFRLFNPDTPESFLGKLYFGYSQTSIVALGASSAPFYDTSYRPSAFYLNEDVSAWPYRKSSRLGFQAGLEHESNGKDGSDSRSIIIGYVRPTLTFPFGDRYFASVSPKIYAYIDKQENPDIPTYRGNTDLLMTIGKTDGIQLATTLRKGTGGDPYSVQVDLSYPLMTPKLGNIGGYLYLQYFDGWGETLLDYDQKVATPQFRFGFMFTR